MQGKVVKIFSDFYYVLTNEGLFECKLREVLKKSGIQILVGDNVLLENENQISKQAAICELLTRTNSISRPAVANIDLLILVISLKHPKTPLTNIDRYLVQSKYFGIDVIICANKADLATEHDKQIISDIYKNLGYEVVFTSATKKTGINELKKHLANKTSIFCGASGVGKTSLCNSISDNFELKTGKVSKNSRGSHTTRHCEILPIDNEANIVDTPGFSLLKFDYIEPQNVKNFFPEIADLAQNCKFSDCLHENETECNVLSNLNKIPQSRYESYLSILNEAKEYKKKIREHGQKIEEKSKQINSQLKPKISARKRDFSRRKIRQNLQFYEE